MHPADSECDNRAGIETTVKGKKVVFLVFSVILFIAAALAWVSYLGQGIAYGDLVGVTGREKDLTAIGRNAMAALSIALFRGDGRWASVLVPERSFKARFGEICQGPSICHPGRCFDLCVRARDLIVRLFSRSATAEAVPFPILSCDADDWFAVEERPFRDA